MTEMETVALAIAMVGGGVGTVLGRNGGIVGDRADETYATLAQAGTPCHLCVEVVNLSAFPVTISDVGFGKTSAWHLPLHGAHLSAGKKWPPRLESREAVTVSVGFGEDPNLPMMQKPVAYAQTDCGITRYGTSPVLKEHVRRVRSAHSRESVDNQEQSTT